MREIRLDGRVAIVTGAGVGLGRSHALALASRGACVVVNDIGSGVDGRGTSDIAGDVVAEIRAAGGSATANHDTVATRAGGHAIAEQAMDEFGRIDVVVANAGVQRNDPYDAYAEQDMHDMLDVHLKGSFWVTQAAYRVMRRAGFGRIVFTTSGAGLYGRPNSPGYVAAKSGIVGLMSSLAIEGQERNVLANAIAPLAFTRMTEPVFDAELAELTPPEFVSDLVVFLASDRCTVTHEVIQAGFGRYARVFTGRTIGWTRPVDAAGGPEDIADHLDEILDTSQFVVPKNAFDDLQEMRRTAP